MMKNAFFVMLLTILFDGCFLYRPCPIKSCRVELEHKHGSKTYNPRKILKWKVHYIGEKSIKSYKKQLKITKERRRMERQRF